MEPAVEDVPEPRPAATVVVARPGSDGVEVLVLRRAAGSRFAPGFLVFPGGTVDRGDTALARRWFGDPSQSSRACAVRELAEEAGLAVTASGLRELQPGEDLLAAIDRSPPPASALPEMARWVAPTFLSVRFDARFFAAAAPLGTTARPDGVEIDRAEWARPDAVLREHRLYESIMWPTYRTLQRLAECSSVDDVGRLWVEQERPPMPGSGRSPEWVRPGEHATRMEETPSAEASA